MANRGTLFLDEIANAPMMVQETLLRAVEYGTFERVGGSTPISVDVRLVAATNADLPALAAEGRFRADLLDRLAFDVITLPPLRERPGDIELLAEAIAIQMTRQLGREVFPGFSPGALDQLRSHKWPGNVRELKNVVERSVYRTPAGRPVAEILIDPFASPWRASPNPTPAGGDFTTRVTAFERDLLNEALKSCAGHRGRAATQLGLTYDQFRGQLRKHRLGDVH
jgi:psp operon transcriptional activator